MTRIPCITILLCILACCLALLSSNLQESLYFDYYSLKSGNWTGLASGHWLHADASHLAWNVGALMILASLIERHSRQLLLWSILVGMCSVDLLLISPFSDITRYCGLSGLLNTLLGVVLCLLWNRTRSRMVFLVGLLSASKIGLEMLMGESLFTNISWPPYPPAHLAGLMGTPIALLLGYRDTVIQRRAASATRTNHEHLVTSA